MDSAPPPDLSDDLEVVKMSDKVGDLKKEEQSWVSVAQDKKRLKKYEVEITNKDGKQVVEIPDEVLTSPTQLWEDFVIGKFLDRAPHVAKVHTVLNRIWKYGDNEARVEVFEVNDMTMRFKVPNPKVREKILRRGMWNILGVPMIVTKWTPTNGEEEKEDEAIPMWVHLEKVPLNMFSWEALSFITSPVGVPVKLHPETLSCSNLDVAKLFVKVDVSKVLPKEITFYKGGKEFTVTYYYPWLPSRCNICDRWGHTENVCGMKSKGKKQTYAERVSGSEGSNVKKAESSLKVVEANGDLNSNESKKNKDKTEEQEGDKQIPAVTEEQLKEVWSSPVKTGRPLSETQNEVIQISASRFSILGEEVEEGELPMNEMSKEEDREDLDETEQLDGRVNDSLEDSILELQEKLELGKKKGLKRGQKPKAQGSFPMSTRSSRHQN